MKKRTSTFPLRLPASLKAASAEISKEDGTSINQFVTTAVAEKISAMNRRILRRTRSRGRSRGGTGAFFGGPEANRRNRMTVCFDRVSR